MNVREERGLKIAALTKINRKGKDWIVPSQSDNRRRYYVNTVSQTCSCPDHAETGFKCKHLFAVEFTMKREFHTDGSMTETQSLTITERTVYPQHARNYQAQCIEKDRVQELLFDLCSGLEERIITGKGQRPHLVKDSIFSMTMMVYGMMSSTRTTCDLKEAHQRGYLTRPIPGMKVGTFMRNPDYTPILKELIVKSASPLKAVETDFAIDSSGFGTNKFEKWFDHKYGRPKTKCVWAKVHIACGVKTNIVTAVRILDKDAADSPQFTPLVKETKRHFEINEVSADKAYSSLENFEAVAAAGGTGFIAFKSNTTGGKGGLFEKMYHYFHYQKEDYMSRYHKRSNVESTFSAIKRKFGDSVRARHEIAITNEVLCKILAHNLTIINKEECELGIEAMFRRAG